MKTILLLTAAVLLFSPGLAQKPKSAVDYFDEGEAALENNKYTLALAKYNECLRLDPYFMEAYHSRASARQGLGDIKGALTDYSIYIESKPNRSDALFSRGVLRYKLEQYLLAREDFLLLLRLPPGETNKIFFRQGPDGTNQVFTMQNSNHADVFNYLALIETRLKNYKQAFTYIDSAVHLVPSEAQYLVNRGIIKEHALDTAGAIADYQKALVIDPNEGSATHNIAVIKRSRGEQAESEKLLNQAIEKSPGLPYPYAARAYFRYHHNDLKGALEDYNKVIQLDPDDEESWLYRGLVKEKMKDTDGAFIAYTQAITLKNDNVRAWLIRGNLLAKLNRFDDAIEDYTVAITWYPEYGSAFYGRAIAYQRSNKLKEACQDVGEAERFNTKVAPEFKAKVCK
jgi:tetratricopeptide (TPR) repeat protein